MKWAALVGASVLLLSAYGQSSARKTSATDQITAAYKSFFPRKGSLGAHVALVQNGPKFRPLITMYLHSGDSRNAWVKVEEVTMHGTDKAVVAFHLHTRTFMAPLYGGAVLDGGKWKLAWDAVCAPMIGDPTVSLPAACNQTTY
jgi:hypothetical protein